MHLRSTPGGQHTESYTYGANTIPAFRHPSVTFNPHPPAAFPTKAFPSPTDLHVQKAFHDSTNIRFLWVDKEREDRSDQSTRITVKTNRRTTRVDDLSGTPQNYRYKPTYDGHDTPHLIERSGYGGRQKGRTRKLVLSLRLPHSFLRGLEASQRSAEEKSRSSDTLRRRVQHHPIKIATEESTRQNSPTTQEFRTEIETQKYLEEKKEKLGQVIRRLSEDRLSPAQIAHVAFVLSYSRRIEMSAAQVDQERRQYMHYPSALVSQEALSETYTTTAPLPAFEYKYWDQLTSGVKIIIVAEVATEFGENAVVDKLALTEHQVKKFNALQDEEATNKQKHDDIIKAWNAWSLEQMTLNKYDQRLSEVELDERLQKAAVHEPMTMSVTRHAIRNGRTFLDSRRLGMIAVRLDSYFGTDVKDIWRYKKSDLWDGDPYYEEGTAPQVPKMGMQPQQTEQAIEDEIDELHQDESQVVSDITFAETTTVSEQQGPAVQKVIRRQTAGSRRNVVAETRRKSVVGIGATKLSKSYTPNDISSPPCSMVATEAFSSFETGTSAPLEDKDARDSIKKARVKRNVAKGSPLGGEAANSTTTTPNMYHIVDHGGPSSAPANMNSHQYPTHPSSALANNARSGVSSRPVPTIAPSPSTSSLYEAADKESPIVIRKRPNNSGGKVNATFANSELAAKWGNRSQSAGEPQRAPVAPMMAPVAQMTTPEAPITTAPAQPPAWQQEVFPFVSQQQHQASKAVTATPRGPAPATTPAKGSRPGIFSSVSPTSTSGVSFNTTPSCPQANRVPEIPVPTATGGSRGTKRKVLPQSPEDELASPSKPTPQTEVAAGPVVKKRRTYTKRKTKAEKEAEAQAFKEQEEPAKAAVETRRACGASKSMAPPMMGVASGQLRKDAEAARTTQPPMMAEGRRLSAVEQMEESSQATAAEPYNLMTAAGNLVARGAALVAAPFTRSRKKSIPISMLGNHPMFDPEDPDL